MYQVLTDKLIELKSRPRDYNQAVRLLCNELPRHNKEIYRLLLKDLIYHFEPTKTSPTRARVEKRRQMWTANTYEEIAERLSKPLKKPISGKTVQRYSKDFVDRGWVEAKRFMFAGKSILHRSLKADKLDFDLHLALYSHLSKEVGSDPLEQFDEDISAAVEKARESAIAEREASTRNEAENKEEARQVILNGDLLFGLGTLANSRRKKTKWAVERITQLVTTDLLSVDAIKSLKDAWEHGAYEGMAEYNGEHYQYWPNWLNHFYPTGRAICQGLAAYWFLDAEPSAHKWLQGEKLQRYLACQKHVIPTFERLRAGYKKEPQPEDYQARDEDGVFNLSRSDIYFRRLYPEKDSSEMEIVR